MFWLSRQHLSFGPATISVFQQQLRPRSIARGRLNPKSRVNRREHAPEKSSSTTMVAFDDEPYHDRDFDFDPRHQPSNRRFQPKKTMKQLFKEDFEAQKLAQQKIRTFVNALYEDDDDDDYNGQNAKNHRQDSKTKHRKDFFKNLHERFEKENLNNPQAEDSGNKIKTNKKREKAKIPLPYDINEENRFEILNKLVTPLHHLPYEIQLKRKYNKNKDVLRSMGRKLRQLDTPIRLDRDDLPCPLEPVRPSPLLEQYRNKDEFSVWPGIDGNPKTVGLFVGQPSLHEPVVCVEPDQIIITKSSHKELARKFQQYLRDVSPYDVCQNYGQGGNWRRVHIRSNVQQQHMITAIMHPQQLSAEQLQEEMDRLRRYFDGDPTIQSLYFHASKHTRSTHTMEPYYHLAGDPTIVEQLFDKQFVISPSSFFQVNTRAAEILYRVIMTEMKLKKNVTVLDLCCGTGTLAVLVSQQVHKVIAIDSSRSAIEDAKQNARLNGCDNIEFMVGTVEEILPRLAEETYLREPVVAIANPSRRALHPYSIRTLKQMNFIERLIYVSCKPEGDALRNFVQLCHTNVSHPSHSRESIFLPNNAILVDLFPHTEHCELVMTFERY